MGTKNAKACAAFLLAAMAVLGAPAPSVQAFQLPSVSVSPNVSIAESKIYLGDLLTAESRSTLPSIKEADRTFVASSPAPGKVKILEPREVLARLTELGITADRYSIRMPSQIRIERKSQTLSPRDVEEMVRIGFLPRLPWEEVRLAEMSIPEEVVLPPGKVDVTFDPPAHANLAGAFHLGINFTVDGQIVKSAYWRTVLAISQTVAVAERDLKPTDRIDAGDIRWEKRAVVSTLRPPVRELEFFENRKLRSVIAAGQVVTEDMFVSLPLVKRGDPVLLVAQSGTIQVSAQGQSLGAGAKGDRIRVMNLTSRKELTAEIVDEKTVKVVF